MYSKPSFIHLKLCTIAYGFIGYDCGGSQVDNYGFQPSGSRRLLYTTTQVEVEHIQLRKAETYSVYFHTRLVPIDYLTTRCSVFEDALVVDGGFFSEIVEL